MDYKKRLSRLRQFASTQNCDAFYLDDPINLFYYTGCALSAGKLIVNSKDAVLIVDGRYKEACEAISPIPVLLVEDRPLREILDKAKRMGFDASLVTHQTYLEWNSVVPGLTLVPLNLALQKLRAIKEAEELQRLKNAAALAVEGFQFVKKTILESSDSLTEIELATSLELFWKRKGGQGVSFEPIIASGSNSSMPHYRAGNGKVLPGQHVLVDIGVKFDGYHSDMTRIVPLGPLDPRISEIEQIVFDAYQKAESLCRNGVSIGEVDRAAREHIAAKGYGAHFTHSLGHGVGLEVHELPLIRDKEPYRNQVLEAGMVLTIEPGIYLPGVGGVRYENTLIINEGGCEVITRVDR